MAKRGRAAGRNSTERTAGVVDVPKGGRPEGPVEGIYYIDTGDCELIADQDNSSGWLLRINGVMSSHIDLADPLFLDFEYMRWIAALVESRWPRESRPKLRALHLGGGSMLTGALLPRRLPGCPPGGGGTGRQAGRVRPRLV